MNYQLIYDNLVNKAIKRQLEKEQHMLENGTAIIKNGKFVPLIKNQEYIERHHIIPRCLGGTDDESNLVDFTYREHYIAHYLLYKIEKNKNNSSENLQKMSSAFFIMMKSNNGKRITNSRMYEFSKKIFIEETKKFNKTEEGKAKIKKAAKKRRDAQQQNFIYHFWHEEYGDIICSTYDLMIKYPEQKLNSSNLVKVGKNERPYHKGWMLYENRNIGVDGFNKIKQEKMSESAIKRASNMTDEEKKKFYTSKGGKAQKGYITHYHETKKPVRALPGSDKSNDLKEQGYFLKSEYPDRKSVKNTAAGQICIYSPEGNKTRVTVDSEKYHDLISHGYWSKDGKHGTIPENMKDHKNPSYLKQQESIRLKNNKVT